MLMEAKKNVAEGKLKQLLSSTLWEWFNLSSQTFLDLFEDGGPADNFPVLRNPEEFPELASINVPILGLMGEYDDIEIRNLKEDLDLIASKATNVPSFEKVFIQKANHNYEQQEEQLAQVVLQWVTKHFR